MERPHREVVGTAVMDSKLFCKVLKGEERMAGVKTFLVLQVTALYLAIVPGRVRTNQFVADLAPGKGAETQGYFVYLKFEQHIAA